ncbi:MAG: PhnD/SsuA/transferrin family substrate-binding protein, partial [Halobacteria archaeon]|nr:PhnD/SsuA/transferrin family substrate-binding protein [Halobacteria archaeon]
DIGNAPTGKPVDFEGTWSNHKAAVQSLINDRADACATWGGQGLAYVPKSQFPPKAKQKSAYYGNAGSKTPHLQVINWSEPIPKQPFIARKTWDSPMKEKIDKALENSSKQKLSKYKPDDYNQTLTFTTLTDTSIEDYQPVIKRVNALGVDLTQG